MPDFIRLPNGDQVRVPDGVPIEEAMAKVRTWYQSQQGQQQIQSATPQAPMQQAQPQAAFGDLRMREDQMPQPQQPSLTPRTDEAVSQAPRFQFTPGASPVGGGGAIPTATTAGMELPAGTGAELLRYGGPAAAAMLFPPAGALATAAMMGGATGLAQLGAQKTEVAQGLRSEVSPGQVVESAIIGATPFPIAQGLSGPFKAAITGAVKQAAISQTVDALARTFDTAVSEGRLPTTTEISKAALDPWTYLPGAIGGLVGGGAGFASRGPRLPTQQEQIGAAGTEAAKRLEAVTGEGMAPLTAAQQTGRNLPGEFAPGTGELAAQQRVPLAVQKSVSERVPPGASAAAAREIAGLSEAESRRLASQIQGTQISGESMLESRLMTAIPGTQRAATTAEAANTSLDNIRKEAVRLKQNETAAFAPFEAEVKRLGGDTSEYVPVNLQKAADDVLSTLATVQKTKEIPSPIIGGEPIKITTKEATALFDESTRLAKRLKEIASSPQTLDQLINVRQEIDNLFTGIDEIAPGFRKAKLTILRNAAKQDELAAARQLGGDAESLLLKAQAVSEDKFKTLEANPILAKAIRDTSELNSFQNVEQFYSELASKPAALDSVRRMLGPDEFNQLRRGMFDSLRDADPVTINGVVYENASALANNFKNLPPLVKETLAGSKFLADDIQKVLDDVAAAQSVGRTVPIREGLAESTLNKMMTETGFIRDPNLRAQAMKDVNDAVARARRYENDITKQARAGTLNPNIDQDEFVRNFVLSSKNPDVVRDAIGLLSPSAREGISKKAAEVFIDHIIGSSKTATSLDELIGDKNRLQILREVLTPNDLQLAKDLMNYQRAVLMTGPQGKLDSSEMAKFVWKVTQARALTDFMVGNAPMQNFISKVARTPEFIVGFKPTISAQAAGRGARAVGVPAELMTAYEEARQSLPEDKRTAFDQAFPIRR